jgi:hypothetical protein
MGYTKRADTIKMILYDDRVGFIISLFIIGSITAFVVATEKNKLDALEQECISKSGYYLRTRDTHVCFKKDMIIKLKGES